MCVTLNFVTENGTENQRLTLSAFSAMFLASSASSLAAVASLSAPSRLSRASRVICSALLIILSISGIFVRASSASNLLSRTFWSNSEHRECQTRFHFQSLSVLLEKNSQPFRSLPHRYPYPYAPFLFLFPFVSHSLPLLSHLSTPNTVRRLEKSDVTCSSRVWGGSYDKNMGFFIRNICCL